MIEVHPAKEHSGHRYRELDALRGIAALVVVFFHVSIRQESLPYFRFGVTGVDLFFIISGFVILMSLSSIRSGKDFVINRVSRLYPTYWTCVTFTFLAMFLINSADSGFPADVYWKQYLANMTMFQHYFGVEDLDGPYWTMIVELLFYIAMLLLYVFRILEKAVGIFFIAALGVTIMALTVSRGEAFAVIKVLPLLSYLPLFLAGIIFYQLFRSGKSTPLQYLLLAGCYAMQTGLFYVSGRAYFFLEQWEYALILLLYFLVFLLFVKGKLNFLVNPVTLFLGKISFALYLVHQFITTLFIIPRLMENGWNYWAATFCVAIPVAIVLATLITFCIEIPAGRRMKSFLRKN